MTVVVRGMALDVVSAESKREPGKVVRSLPVYVSGDPDTIIVRGIPDDYIPDMGDPVSIVCKVYVNSYGVSFGFRDFSNC